MLLSWLNKFQFVQPNLIHSQTLFSRAFGLFLWKGRMNAKLFFTLILGWRINIIGLTLSVFNRAISTLPTVFGQSFYIPCAAFSPFAFIRLKIAIDLQSCFFLPYILFRRFFCLVPHCSGSEYVECESSTLLSRRHRY